MPLPVGTPLGPYEILAPHGAGGMGEVYRARDKRLDRTVALKVLPEHLRDDPQLKNRFEGEARAVSSLNAREPILAVHGLRSADAGETWSELNSGLTSLTVWSLAMHPFNTNALYAGTSGGVFVITLE
jgi:serine/threonine protein kinase